VPEEFMGLFQIKPASARAREDVFAEKYAWLLGWALHFTQGNQATAEDLVQDTFIRFVSSKTACKDTEHVEALLYTNLKYAYLTHLRRLQRHPASSLSIAEFDSLQMGLRESQDADQMEVQDALRRTVAYLSWRKESAKSASLLILRFFHGYYPDEIMRLARTSNPSVRKGLQEARQEASIYLSDPGRLRIMHLAAPPEIPAKGVAIPPEQLIAELQETIFASCRSECLTEDQLRKRYQVKDSKPIDRELLAHLVSCKRCLHLASGFCRIDPPSGRSPVESLGPDRRSRQESRKTSTGSGNSINRVLQMARDRARETFEHFPRQLTVVINGTEIVTQDVNSCWNRQRINLRPETDPKYIEVISEQGVCLLTMQVDTLPPEAPPEIRQQIELSHGRRIEACLQFTALGTCLEVAYHDASLAEDLEGEGQRIETANESPASPVSIDAEKELPGKKAPWHGWKQLWDKARKLFPSRLRPKLAGALALLVVLAISDGFWLHHAMQPKAGNLLIQAVEANTEGRMDTPPGVVYQSVEIRAGNRRLRRTIMRDAQHRRQHKPQKLTAEETALRNNLALAGVDWNDPLSAAGYKVWHDDQNVASDTVEKSGELLTLAATMRDGEVAKTSITFRASDFHPVQRTIAFRNGEQIEITELSYSVLPWSKQTEPLFMPPLPAHECKEISAINHLLSPWFWLENTLAAKHETTGEHFHEV
jgi:RNA polymerase sigma factor (sigma-70 family)